MNTSPFLSAQIKDGAAGLAIENAIAAITAAYHTQHNADDTHKTITATGSISERKRTTPMGVWIDLPYSGISFGSDTATATWTVPKANVDNFRYMLIGQTMTISWSLSGTTIGTTAAQGIYFTLPVGTFIQSGREVSTAFPYNDNGTTGIGMARSIQRPNGGPASIVLFKNATGSVFWTVSPALYVFGQITFEVTGI